MTRILLATNNDGKVERFRNLVQQLDVSIELYTPRELGVEAAHVEESGTTLAENAILKAQAYMGKTDLPILANDTGLYIEGEGFIDAPKRTALGETSEHALTEEEVAERVLHFWKNIATKYGGEVDGAWVEAFVVMYPDGTIKHASSRREIVLTDQVFGVPHLHMPVRALYYSKATGKPVIQHTKEEELLEMQPVIDALRIVLVT